MGAQITFSDDVGIVATAENADGSIRWHVYERTVAGITSIYVQRELSSVLQAEVKLLVEGDRPSVFFNPDGPEWVLLYRLNERMWMIRYTETEVPVTQSAQSDTILDQWVIGSSDDQRLENVAQRQAVLTESAPTVDAYSGPPPMSSVGIGSGPLAPDVFGVVSSSPGTFRIRWRARDSVTADGNAHYDADPDRFYVYGFHVYRRRFDSNALERLTSSPVLFRGFDPVIYEFECPAVAGTYFVTQLNRQGPASSNIVEGRVHSPRDTIRSDGRQLPDIARSMVDAKIGDGLPGEALRFVVVSFAAVNIFAPLETFSSFGPGEGGRDLVRIDSFFTTLNVDTPDDSYPSHGPGEGFRAVISETGYGTVSVG